MDPFSQLSLDQLAHLLSHVDIKPRLSCCSLVSSTWRTAAARATTSIRVDRRAPLASFEQWLWAHTAKVQVSSLTVATSSTIEFMHDGRELCLPAAQLQSLKELELQFLSWSTATPAQQDSGSASSSSSSSANASNQGLAGLTALTRLAVSGDSVWLAGLSKLTGLQELCCEGQPDKSLLGKAALITGLSTPAQRYTEAVLIAAFPQLQHLTSLTLRRNLASTAIVSSISALQCLQQLELHDTTAAARSFAVLPQSLKQLNMSFALGRSLTASNAAGLSRLTALQSLYICDVVPLDCALLAGMRNLRSLRLFDCELAVGGLRLQVVSSFTALTCLKVARVFKGPPATVTAAEAGALTASSQLAELQLSGLEQLQDYASLFPPGRQLQHLTELVFSADLLSNPAAVRQAGKCCPNLHSLVLVRAQHSLDDEAATVVESLAAMSAWSSLHELQLVYPWLQLPLAAQQSAWQALGTRSQLTALQIQLNQVPARGDMLHLTACTALQALKISCTEEDTSCYANFTSTMRLVPDRCWVGMLVLRPQVSLPMCGAACLTSCVSPTTVDRAVMMMLHTRRTPLCRVCGTAQAMLWLRSRDSGLVVCMSCCLCTSQDGQSV